MALHFDRAEFDARRDRLMIEMAEKKLDAVLLFAQESMYWLTGYDTFGYVFFQCLVITADGRMVLLTRAPDLRQAPHTSTLDDIRIWVDSGSAHPAEQLKSLVADMGLRGAALGIEYDTHGLTAANGRAVDAALGGFVALTDASDLLPGLVSGHVNLGKN